MVTGHASHGIQMDRISQQESDFPEKACRIPFSSVIHALWILGAAEESGDRSAGWIVRIVGFIRIHTEQRGQNSWDLCGDSNAWIFSSDGFRVHPST
ncbi:MAG: hypothetical protein LBI66_03235 [Burkholderiaceae bacterium]|nr:hypothetical protein [Burkholderiaceae bacterium]